MDIFSTILLIIGITYILIVLIHEYSPAARARANYYNAKAELLEKEIEKLEARQK